MAYRRHVAIQPADLVVDASSPDNVGKTIDALRRHCGLTTKGLAYMAGIKRSTLHTRIAGADATTGELHRLAQVFAIPITVLFIEPDLALRWVLDHPAVRPATVSSAKPGYLSSPRIAAA